MVSQFIVIEGALDSGEVGRLNDALDAHEHLSSRSPSYSGDNPGMQGDGNPIKHICSKLLELPPADGLTFQGAVASLREAGFPPDTPPSGRNPTAGATADDLRAALTTMELPAADRGPLSSDQIEQLVVAARPDEAGEISLGSTRIDLGGMLQWEQPHW